MSRISNMAKVLDQPCHYCGKVATTADHVVPRSMGGTDARWNLVPACRLCNQTKADRLTDCHCSFCVAAFAHWKGPRTRTYPIPLKEVDTLQAWLDRHLPGQTV